MRLICTFNHETLGRRFALFLKTQGILNDCEIIKNTDWGSSEYGNVTCNIWVHDEDQVFEAREWSTKFLNHPNDPIFSVADHTNSLQKKTSPNTSTFHDELKKAAETPFRILKHKKQHLIISKASQGRITFYLILICAWLFMWSQVTTPDLSNIPSFVPAAPLVTSPIEKKLFFDYPQAYEYIDKILVLYGIDKLSDPEDLPTEGQHLLAEYYRTPIWQGFYDKALKDLTLKQNKTSHWDPNILLFEKIRTGEVWRLITPCLLHSDLLHILFNMMWLYLLGQQMESRLSKFRFIFFMILTGIFSNTAQYLMGGANFIGFSGILCAMLAFIWMRQRIAPWEGYPIQRATLGFMALFIFAMAGIQLASFLTEAYLNFSFSPRIANTAHLSGAFIGALLGRLKFFAAK